MLTPEQRETLEALELRLSETEASLAAYGAKTAAVLVDLKAGKIDPEKAKALLELYAERAEADKATLAGLKQDIRNVQEAGVPWYWVALSLLSTGGIGGLLAKWRYGKYVNGFVQVVRGVQRAMDRVMPKDDEDGEKLRDMVKDILSAEQTASTKALVQDVKHAKQP